MIACRDCVHLGPIGGDPGEVEPRCHHPRSFIELPNYLTGTKHTVTYGISAMRSLGPCGPEGKLFAAAEHNSDRDQPE